MKLVKTVMHEKNVVHHHKHIKQSQNTDQKCKSNELKKLEKQEYKEECAKKTSVEESFGILKEQFNIKKK